MKYTGFADPPLHIGLPPECRRCQTSERPPCPHCGHKLMGYITGSHYTACENCHRLSVLDSVSHTTVLYSVD